MPTIITAHAKFLIVLLGALVNFLGQRWGTDSAAYDDVVMLVTAATAWLVPNSPS